MDPKLKVVAETLPERCDVCHQSDLFNPQTGYCDRCRDTTALVMQSHQAQFVPKFLSQYQFQPASTGKRFANLVIDTILCQIFTTILLIIPFIIIGMVRPEILRTPILDWVFSLLLYFIYYFVFEGLFQRTPAKFITGTKVIKTDGSKPDAATVAKRTLSRLVPFEIFSRSEGTWWHDRWADTLVVDARSNDKGM
jgi:uncharacterized RDD family membrane protein YckC